MWRTAFGIQVRPQLEEILPSIPLSLQKGAGPAAVEKKIAARMNLYSLNNRKDFESCAVFFMYIMV